jgi:hypothetical protein
MSAFDAGGAGLDGAQAHLEQPDTQVAVGDWAARPAVIVLALALALQMPMPMPDDGRGRGVTAGLRR